MKNLLLSSMAVVAVSVSGVSFADSGTIGVNNYSKYDVVTLNYVPINWSPQKGNDATRCQDGSKQQTVVVKVAAGNGGNIELPELAANPNDSADICTVTGQNNVKLADYSANPCEVDAGPGMAINFNTSLNPSNPNKVNCIAVSGVKNK